MLVLIVQEDKGGYRDPKREFMTVRDFDQFGGADFKNRCYTSQRRGLQPRFDAYSLVFVHR